MNLSSILRFLSPKNGFQSIKQWYLIPYGNLKEDGIIISVGDYKDRKNVIIMTHRVFESNYSIELSRQQILELQKCVNSISEYINTIAGKGE